MLMQTECTHGNAERDLRPCWDDSYRGRYTAEGPLMTRFPRTLKNCPQTGLCLGLNIAPWSSDSDVLLHRSFHFPELKNAASVNVRPQRHRLFVVPLPLKGQRSGKPVRSDSDPSVLPESYLGTRGGSCVSILAPLCQCSIWFIA